MTEYKISASLAGHEDDVRAVAFPSSKAVISGSRDGTVRLFKLLSDSPPVYDATISSHASAFVNAVSYLPPSPHFPEGLILSGGKDTIIEVRVPSKAPEDNAEALLIGHAGNVCALDVDPAGKYIVSGSWDCEARIWPVGKWECQTVLKGHEASVWGVLAYDSETIITASADQKIRIFHISGKLLRTIKASQEVVRALCRVRGHPSGADFASAGNDAVIRLWTIGGEQVGELHGHENFIYHLASSPSGEIVSSSEDRTARIWKGLECVQTITHPAISVWSVAVCAENGDIVTGASDRITRVFTRSPERAADAETSKQFEDAVKESSIPQQSLAEVNKEKLPGPEFLVQKRGTKEGQVQMIRELNGNVTAHTWSTTAGQWVNVGTVVDAVGSSGKKIEYLGKEYDYVFDVDIEDGKPPLKLPYNLSQNPYEAATKFIQDNELPITYLDTVATFITENTKGATLGQSQDSAVSAPGSDPWGSDQRCRPAGDSNPAAPPSLPKLIPQKEFISIMNTPVSKAQKKIEELNAALIESGQKGVSLNPTELTILASLCKHLGSGELAKAKTSQSVAGGLDLVIKLVTEWPYKDRLPGLDLLRLLVVAPLTATYVHPRYGNIVNVLIGAATEGATPAENHVMMAVRGLGNLFESPEGRALALSQFALIQSTISKAITNSTNRNLHVAATTVYINYAVLFKTHPSSDHAFPVLETLAEILSKQSDSEVIYRAIVATGTLVTLGDEEKSAAKDVYEIEKALTIAVSKANEPRIRRVVNEVKSILK